MIENIRSLLRFRLFPETFVNACMNFNSQNENKLLGPNLGVIFFSTTNCYYQGSASGTGSPGSRKPDVTFDFESNGRNFSSLAPPCGEKKIFLFVFYKMRSRKGVSVFRSTIIQKIEIRTKIWTKVSCSFFVLPFQPVQLHAVGLDSDILKPTSSNICYTLYRNYQKYRYINVEFKNNLNFKTSSFNFRTLVVK